MQGVPALLADKEQALPGPVLAAGVATARAGLAGIVGIHLDAQRPGEDRLIGEQPVQLGEGPPARVPVGAALPLRRLLAVLALGAVPNARELFQPDEGMGMGVQDALADRVVGIQLQPSLSRADGDSPPGGAASAFSLKSFLQAGVMVRLAADLLSGGELGAMVQGRHRGQIPLPDVHAEHLVLAFRRRVRRLEGEGDQQVEPLLAPVIPELGPADGGSLLEQGHVATPALVRDVDPPPKRQEAHLLPGSQRIIAAQIVGEGRRDVMGRLVQALEASFGGAQATGLGVLLRLGPQRLIGAAHLAGHIAGHLGGQAKLAAQVSIGRFLQPLAAARFPVGKGVGADIIQGSPIRQLGGAQRTELVRRGQQFQFGGQGGLHPRYSTT